MTYRLTALLLLAGGLAAGVTGVATTAQQPAASASAYAISVIVPGQAGAAAGGVSVPGGDPTSLANSFAYPADGSIVRAGALSSSASASPEAGGASDAVTDVLGVSLFNGEITLDGAAGRARSSSFAADTTGSSVTNLLVAGQAVGAAPNQRVALGDWGTLVTLEGAAERTTGSTIDAHATVTAVRVTLTAEHGGLPAGSEILIGHAETAISVPVPPEALTPTTPTTPTTSTTSTTTTTSEPAPPNPRPAAKKREKLPKPSKPRADPSGIPRVKVLPAPTSLFAPLSPGGFVFPIYGDAGFSDTWGAPRATTGRHQGTDIFAPLGAPVLAVADGTVFSVGWNAVGGWRLWLRDRAGNQFYYAHLSAYSPLAVDGTEVRAGQVIGFNGNSGDAQGTPYHVHFEIHPVALLPLGYEGGAVNPYLYLGAWRRLLDVDLALAVGYGWAPPVPAAATAPRPGAFLLGSTDISNASGLDPGSLERALVAPVSAEGDGALLRS
ncbi:MAG: M23 family metallopeptidase [Gaiellaceae bacterium MAG52_C11]|nr:M23 family metallopeptidase [Candidatus Gaiellasilicea maunaloa]